MKKNLHPVWCIFVLFACSVTSCQKDNQNKVPVADAGDSRAITLPIDTVTLTGTGKDADGSIMGYIWSQVSGPTESEIMNPGAASSIVNFTAAGTYLFQLMVVDNGGATGIDTISVIVNPSPIDTLSLQPSQNANEIMIWGNGTNLEESWNQSPETGAAAWTSDGDPVFMRGALRFDLSAIPQTATILSADLYLYSDPHPINGDLVHANSGTSNSMLVQQITQTWTSSTVTWNNQPTTTSTNQVLIPSTDQSFLDLDIDVKEIVTDMVSQNKNYGFLLKLQTEQMFNSRMFCSSYNTDASKHPKLVVIFKN